MPRLGRIGVQDHQGCDDEDDDGGWTGAGSSTDIYPMFLNEVIGTKFRVITGYLGSQETIIAIERGEVDGRCGWGWSSLKSTKPDWVRDKKVT